MDEYEEYEEYEEEDKSSTVNKILIILIILLLLAVSVVGFFLFKNSRKDTHIGLALTQEELDSAMDDAQAIARSGNIALRFKNDAYSEDGKLFTCYIMNSQLNIYDMFLTIYADEALTDELFSSGLISPGRGFDQLKLNHSLNKGTNTVYVVLTQVDTDEDGVQTIVGQASHTMKFIVE